MTRKKGKCPTCGRIIAVKIGVGPYGDGRGHVMDHRNRSSDILAPGAYCLGGKALEMVAEEEKPEDPCMCDHVREDHPVTNCDACPGCANFRRRKP